MKITDPEPPEPPCESNLITITNQNLGRVTVREDQVITFTPGLVGFGKFSRYVLIDRPQDPPFRWLLCVDNPDLAFVVMAPVRLVADYQVLVSDAVLKDLAAETLEDLTVLVIVTIPAGRPREATANLTAPLLINPITRNGKQVLMGNSAYTHAHRIFSR